MHPVTGVPQPTSDRRADKRKVLPSGGAQVSMMSGLKQTQTQGHMDAQSIHLSLPLLSVKRSSPSL